MQQRTTTTTTTKYNKSSFSSFKYSSLSSLRNSKKTVVEIIFLHIIIILIIQHLFTELFHLLKQILYYNTRQPLSSINTNFQPISPHHHQYGTRPVDILKPTFLIVPKEAEQQLSCSTFNIKFTCTNSKYYNKIIN